jgi:cyclopropane fatty-acyl-phospholipid synthase-like methyltransferase
MTMLAYSEACERNKEPILAVLRTSFADVTRVLEIGSGTGQHAVHFARHLPHLEWQPTDLAENLDSLAERLRAEGPPNLAQPLELDVRSHPWPIRDVDGIFSANSLHIMSFDSVREFFRGVGQVLAPNGRLCIYGPFNQDGRYTSGSNAEFDRYLKARDPESGIRDFDAVDSLARNVGLSLEADHAMPANNRTLVWRKVG